MNLYKEFKEINPMMHHLKNHLTALIGLALIGLFFCPMGMAADAGKPRLRLENAVMCEAIANFQPINPGLVFSVNVGKIICFTQFSGIESEISLLHKWYRLDQLVTTRLLMLKTPRWATYSSIHLRESDRGPWRVDIVDADNRVLEVLRFSVTD